VPTDLARRQLGASFEANKQPPVSRGEMSVTLKSDVNLLIALPKHRSVLSFVAVERIGPTPHTGPCVPRDQGSPRLAAPPKNPRGIPRKYHAVRPHSSRARPACGCRLLLSLKRLRLKALAVGLSRHPPPNRASRLESNATDANLAACLHLAYRSCALLWQPGGLSASPRASASAGAQFTPVNWRP
jgi:hypothetical protein